MDDFKEVAYFSIDLIIAGFIITLVAALSLLVGQMADTRNAELMAQETVREARYFAAYDNTQIIGADAIALMRENTLSAEPLDIVLDRDAYGVTMTMNADNISNAAWRLENLTQRITSDEVYRAILVYDGENPATAVFTSDSSRKVTGIRIMPG